MLRSWCPLVVFEAMRSVGLVSKVLDKLKYLVFRQELVGIDVSGNKYYRWDEENRCGASYGYTLQVV